MKIEVTYAAPSGCFEEHCSSGHRPDVVGYDKEDLPVDSHTKPNLVTLCEDKAPVRMVTAAENQAQLFQAVQEK